MHVAMLYCSTHGQNYLQREFASVAFVRLVAKLLLVNNNKDPDYILH